MLKSIQLLRALAAILVMLFHGTVMFKKSWNFTLANNIFINGGIGVDIFFIISGFIIYWTSQKMEPGIQSMKLFLKKRLIRIYPIYWVINLPFLLYYLHTPSPEFLLTPAFAVGSLALAPQKKYLIEVAWTLRFEIVFYLIFGLTFFLNRALFIFSLLAWILAGIIFGSIMKIEASAFYHYWVSGLVTEFGYGVFIAYLYLINYKKWGKEFLLFGIILILVVLFLSENVQQLIIGRELVFGIPAAFLVYGSINSINKAPKLLCLIGDASYSLYLLHATLISQSIKLISKMQLAQYLEGYFGATLIFVMVLFTSVSFYNFIEKPLLNRLNNKFIKNALPKYL